MNSRSSRQAAGLQLAGLYAGQARHRQTDTCNSQDPFPRSYAGELVDTGDGRFSGHFDEQIAPGNPVWRIYDLVGTSNSSGALSGTARLSWEGFTDFVWSATFEGSYDGATLTLTFTAPGGMLGNVTHCGVIIPFSGTPTLGDCDLAESVSTFEDFGSSGGSRVFPVDVSSNDCRWAASLESPASWLTFSPSTGTEDGQISVQVNPLPTVGPDLTPCGSRTAYINVRTRRSTQTITIHQSAIPSVRCPCPYETARKLNRGGSESLDYARRFRDEVLARTARGAEYTRLYYTHAEEVTAILEANPWLLVRAARLLDRHTPALRAIVDGGRSAISDADLDEIDALVADVAASGSPALRHVAARVRRDLGDEAVRTPLRVDVRPGAPSSAKRANPAEDRLFTSFAGLGALDASDILAVAARGREYARASEEHAGEVLALLASDPRLALRAPGAYARLTSALESVVRTGGATIGAETRDEIDAFLAGLEGSASPDLHGAIVTLRRDLRAPNALEGFGVSTPSDPTAGAGAPRTSRALAEAVDYATYFGGSSGEAASQVALDAGGNIYLVGSTAAADFPVSAGAQMTYGGGDSDAFVVKLDPTASTVLFATFLGGSGQDIATGVAIDAAGTVYVSGTTTSTNFPVVSGFQTALRGERDGFLAKLNPTGSALTLSTYLGGSDSDSATGVAVSGKNVYVTGITSSADFPSKKPYQRSLSGSTDAFVVKLKKGGAKIGSSTFFGGSGLEYAAGIAVDSAGNAYIAGVTSSADMPTSGPVQSQFRGLFDGFVAKLGPKGNTLVYATYLGGDEVDGITGIAIDAAGNAYVTGTTASTNFPVSSALQPSYGGGLLDAFVAKLRPDGASLAYSTFLGGSDEDRAGRLAVDSAGRAYLTGLTASTNFPTRNPAQAQLDGDAYDAFVSVVEASGASLASSTFLGGTASDGGVSLAVGADGSPYVVGDTVSTDFPVVGGIQGTIGGGPDLFVVWLKPE